MPAKHMKTTTLVTKAELHDYVTKFEFNEFVGDMRDFRQDANERFNKVGKRFDSIDRRIDRLEESFRVQTGVILEEMRSLSQATVEYLKGMESRLDSRIDGVESKLTNIDSRLMVVETKIGG